MTRDQIVNEVEQALLDDSIWSPHIGRIPWRDQVLPLIEDQPDYWETFAPNYTQQAVYEYRESVESDRALIRGWVAHDLACDLVDSPRSPIREMVDALLAAA